MSAQLKALPCKTGSPAHTSNDRAHGRVEKRTIKVATLTTGILLPHARQAIHITRTTRRLDSTTWTIEVAHAITSLAAEQATPPSWPPGHAATGTSKCDMRSH